MVRHSTWRNRRVVVQFFRNFDALNGVVEFLSAQIAEIWACWKEFIGLFGDLVPIVQQKLTDLCANFSNAQGVPVQCIVPGVAELVDHFPDSHVLAHSMFVLKHVSRVVNSGLEHTQA